MKKMQGCLFHILTNPTVEFKMHFRNLNQRWVCPCLTKTCLEFSIDLIGQNGQQFKLSYL